MKKILTVLVLIFSLLAIPVFACSDEAPKAKAECEYRGFIKAVEAYAFYNGTYVKEVKIYQWIAVTDSYLLLIEKNMDRNALYAIYIDRESMELILIGYDKAEKTGQLVFGLLTFYGVIPIDIVDLDVCAVEDAMVFFYKMCVDADHQLNMKAQPGGF